MVQCRVRAPSNGLSGPQFNRCNSGAHAHPAAKRAPMPSAYSARRQSWRRTGRIAITTTVASALIATLWGPAANAAPLKDDPAWKPKKEKPVPTKPFKAIPKAADPAEAAAAKPVTNKVTWPKAGTAEVAVPA